MVSRGGDWLQREEEVGCEERLVTEEVSWDGGGGVRLVTEGGIGRERGGEIGYRGWFLSSGLERSQRERVRVGLGEINHRGSSRPLGRRLFSKMGYRLEREERLVTGRERGGG
ncbi:hypothetical protein RRG08_004447 [Elysia crispata]|uniref:Uncharacterized protein n=1 Tax=Elysia crispata TaxID=231223 RepID=A0AAE1AXA2_9GAST|nr:hypothetical protein RRG08_004447 [Elysia crispata]